ncbi:hypothetical protein RIF29_39854 [Crotalaria pallida]|uniref:Uncharacterized protein n=1 Tax=Crotalaria pallida TaxID=3830 RepID=A0AAN9HPZ6_CROPI
MVYHIGGCWTCYCPHGEVVSLPFCEDWMEVRKKFGIGDGQIVRFYYLGDKKFKLEIEGWDDIVFPFLAVDNEDDNDEESGNDGAGGSASVGIGETSGSASAVA